MSEETLAVIPLIAATLEKVATVISTTQDPTGSLPEFTVTVDTNGQPTGWQNGSWDGTFAAGQAKALSPTIGATGVIVIAPEDFSVLFIRWTRGAEKPVRKACLLDVS